MMMVMNDDGGLVFAPMSHGIVGGWGGGQAKQSVVTYHVLTMALKTQTIKTNRHVRRQQW